MSASVLLLWSRMLKQGLRIFSSTVGRSMLAVFAIGVPAALVYLRVYGFGPDFTARFSKILSGPAIRVEIGALAFDPFHGFLAKDVHVFRRGNPDVLLARLDRLGVAPNASELLGRRIVIESLELARSQIVVPLGPERDAPSLTVDDVHAEIHYLPGKVRVTRAALTVKGIRATASGWLALPPGNQLKEPKPEGHGESDSGAARKVLELLQPLIFNAPGPRLDFVFSGDLGDLSRLALERLAFQSGPFRYGDIEFRGLELVAQYTDQVLQVTKLRVDQPKGSVSISGSWPVAGGEASLSVAGEVDGNQVVRMLKGNGIAKKTHFAAPVNVAATVGVDARSKPVRVRAVGHFEAGPLSVKNVRIAKAQSDFAWRDGNLYFRDAEVRTASGSIKTDVLWTAKRIRVRLASDLMPSELFPLFSAKARETLDLLQFKDPPRLRFELSGPKLDFAVLSGQGEIQLGRTAMRGSWIDFGKAKISIADRAVNYRDIIVGLGKARGTGEFTYDFGQREVRVSGVRSNLMPSDVLLWIDPRIAKVVSDYRFRSNPNVTADGLIHMADATKNRLKITVDAPGGLDYRLLNRDLPFGRTQANIEIRSRRVIADVMRAALYNGNVSVKANVSIDSNDRTLAVGLKAEKVDFASITKLYFNYQKSQGRMTGDYNFTARMGEQASMRGAGSIRVEEGDVLAIPLFGPISEVLSKLVPGAGYDPARLATADFTVADGKIASKNLEIQGGGFTLLGNGNVEFGSGAMDMTVRINARGVPGVVLFPVSKLFEYVSTGTVSNPRWRPKIIPKEFLNILGSTTAEIHQQDNAPTESP